LKIWKGKFVTKYVKVTYLDHFLYSGNDPYRVPKHNTREVTGWLLEEDDDSLLIGIDLPKTDGADFKMMRLYKWGVLAIDVLKEIEVPGPKLADYF